MNKEPTAFDSTVGNAHLYGQRLTDWLASEKRQKWMLRFLYVLLAVNLFVLGLYVFHGYQNYFHTDASTKNLLAQEMWETGQFFPREWNYANRDLMVVFGQLLIWPLLPFFKNGFALHAVSGLVFSAVILAGIWKLTALTSDTRWQRVMVTAVLAGGVSLRIAENIFGQVSYGVVLLYSSVVILVSWSTLQTHGRRLRIGLVVVALVLFLATWSNPQRALISYVIPLFSAIGVNMLWGGAAAELGSRFRRSLFVSLAAMLGVAMGVVASFLVIAEVQNNHAAAAAHWLDFDGFLFNLSHSAGAVLAMLGGVPPAGADVVSLDGVYVSIRLVAAVALLFMLPWALARGLSERRPVLKFFAAFVAFQLAATLFLFVTTTIPDMSDPMNSGRYLAPPVLLALVLLFSLPLPRANPLRNSVVLGLMCVMATNSIVRLGQEALPVRSHNSAREAVVGALTANNLHYGYASYWNSGAYTVLSSGDVRIRQVLFFNGLPIPMRHLGSNRWYEPDAWHGSTFLLLDKSEEANIDWSQMEAIMGVVPKRIEAGHLIAFVYPFNIAEKMPRWTRLFRHPVAFPALAGSMRNQGHWDELRKAVTSEKGEAGFLAYGPYIFLPGGRYRAEFMIEAAGAAEGTEAAVIDIVYGGGSKVVASLPVGSPSSGPHQLEFELAEPAEQLEMRVQATGEANLTYRGIVLHPVGRNGSDQ